MRLHRQIGEALEGVSIGEPPLGELAYHWFQAAPGGASAKALEYATRAAEQAMAQVAYEEAARFYDYALQEIGNAWGLHHCLDPRCAMYPHWTPSYPNGDASFCVFCRETSEQKIRLAKS